MTTSAPRWSPVTGADSARLLASSSPDLVEVGLVEVERIRDLDETGTIWATV